MLTSLPDVCVEKTEALVPLSVNNSPVTNVPTVSKTSNKTVDVFAEDFTVDALPSKSLSSSVAEKVPVTFESSVQT